MRNRETFSVDDVHWADLVIAAGGIHTDPINVNLVSCVWCSSGDGNFLFTASKVHSPDKLVVGVNTDPYK